MPIKFHCSHCDSLIKAPDQAGGKRGKCPNCKQSVYIPTPSDELEELAIAPLDDESERQAEALADEARRYQSLASHENKEPPGPAGGEAAAADTAMAPPRPEELIEVPGLIVQFVAAMRDSKLDEADQIAGQLRGATAKVKDEVQRLMVDELPPASLEDLPPALYKGFLRALLDRL